MTIRWRFALLSAGSAAFAALAIGAVLLVDVGPLAPPVIAVAAAAVLVAAAAGWFVGSSASRGLSQLREGVRNRSVPEQVDGPPELGRLAEALAESAAGVERGRAHRQRLLADLSHELRTPVTALRSNLETLSTRGDALTGSQRDSLLEAAHAESQELAELVTQLVDLAIDASDDEPETPIDLTDLANRVATRYRRRTGRNVVVVSVEPPEEVNGRRSELERAVSNLIDNALKWGPDDAPVEVVVSGRTLMVSDHGPGIPDEDLPRVFERFYRSPRNGNIPGSGLGLAIVAEVVTRHRGQVLVRNNTDGGATVGFTLPSARVG